MMYIILLLLMAVLTIEKCYVVPSPVCSSPIYCYGELLHSVQMSSIYPDSKTFVDMKMKYNSSYIISNFSIFLKINNGTYTDRELQDFVDAFFDPVGSELEPCIPDDWNEKPAYIDNIKDDKYRQWAFEINAIWKQLSKKMNLDVKNNPHLYSALYVPQPFIIPGGRFREFYYWDSYWILRGLLVSGMKSSSKNILLNYLSLVERFGMVPNGGRIYYSGRSQPPLLIPMFENYLTTTNDFLFLQENIHLLEKEFSFWLRNRMTGIAKHGVTYRVAIYRDQTYGPRPESYKADKLDASFDPSIVDENILYTEIKSAAESGWDFSSRWLLNPNQNIQRTTLITTSIIPVDLNAIICWNAKLLSKFHLKLNNTMRALYYKNIADEWIDMLENVLWNADEGTWFDFDMYHNVSRKYFYASNIAPLWTRCYYPEKKEYYQTKSVEYLEKNIDNYVPFKGGVPASLIASGEQWDYPNGWAPLQHMIITALRDTGENKAESMAYLLADRWVRNVYKMYRNEYRLYEKYHTNEFEVGDGGEYETQDGFGWTNGVIMELLNMYGKQLHSAGLLESDLPLPVVRGGSAYSTLLGIRAVDNHTLSY